MQRQLQKSQKAVSSVLAYHNFASLFLSPASKIGAQTDSSWRKSFCCCWILPCSLPDFYATCYWLAPGELCHHELVFFLKTPCFLSQRQLGLVHGRSTVSFLTLSRTKSFLKLQLFEVIILCSSERFVLLAQSYYKIERAWQKIEPLLVVF